MVTPTLGLPPGYTADGVRQISHAGSPSQIPSTGPLFGVKTGFILWCWRREEGKVEGRKGKRKKNEDKLDGGVISGPGLRFRAIAFKEIMKDKHFCQRLQQGVGVRHSS